MLTGIDHLVIVVADLDAAIASYTQLGFTVVRGGRHPGLGTYNALIAFADGAYFELIAFEVPSSPHWWYAALGRGGGLVDFCMASDDLAADVATLRRAGVEIADPSPLGRERPDGYKLSWVLAVPRSPYSGIVPFLIKDETPREERVPKQRTHRNGATGASRLTVAVEDAAAIRRYYAAILSSAGQEVERSERGGAGVSFMVGPHELQFIARTASTGPIDEWLRARGPSPFEATLRASLSEPKLLDPGKTRGARLWLA